MIRFVDLGSQISCDDKINHFAWWNTVVDKFMAFDEEYIFDSWDKFVNATRRDQYSYDLNRFRYLFTRGDFDVDEEQYRAKFLPYPFMEV